MSSKPDGDPLRRFTATNKAVNAMLEEFAHTQEQVEFLDCGPKFLDKEDPSMLDMKLIPDALHPNAAGGGTSEQQ